MSKQSGAVSAIKLKNKNEIIVEKYESCEDVAFHTHEFIEIAYIEQGEGSHEIQGGYSSPIEKGDVILLNSSVAHSYTFKNGSTAVIYNCLFDPHLLNDSIAKSDDFINIVYSYLFDNISKNTDGKPYIVLKKATEVGGYFKEMFSEYTEKKNGYAKVNAANLIRLLVAIFRIKRNEAEYDDSAYRNSVAQSAARYMNEYYAEKITCEELAERAYLSTGYFHKIFKAATGKTPVEYLQNIRMEKAAELLSETSLNVQNVASEVGYSDMKHFYNGFYKKYKTTPKKYREDKKDLSLKR